MNLMGRAALQARVRANGRDVYLVVAHLKSKLLTFPGGLSPANEDQRARFAAYALYRRASEATTLRTHLGALLAGQGKTKPVILMGDMNDEPDAATTLILIGPPGSEIGSVGFDQPDQGDGDRMWNTPALIEETKRFSRLYRGRLELIDHVFVSHFLVTGTHTVEVTTVTAPQGMPSIEDAPTPGSASQVLTTPPSSPRSTSRVSQDRHARVCGGVRGFSIRRLRTCPKIRLSAPPFGHQGLR
jgi:endonuclease/exonuclease/phosphatase family protein